MYNSLHNPQKVWRLNDETGKFEELKNFTALMEGTTNEYIWRMGEYDGQLYISTMDAGIFYGYMTQLSNGSFLQMTPEEIESKIKYVSDAVEMLAQMKGEQEIKELKTKIQMLTLFLSAYLTFDTDSEEIKFEFKYKEMIEVIKTLIQIELNSMEGDNLTDKAILEVLKKAKEELQALADKIDVEGVKKYLYINNLVKNNEWGFDLFRTSDGETFETITRNGFNDKYNYGCPSFLATEEGLYIGTCNPFYGGQLYLLTNLQDKDLTGIGNSESEELTTGISDFISNPETQAGFYSIEGRRLNGKPARSGFYIHNGRKIVIE
jgi:hypothetical protein